MEKETKEKRTPKDELLIWLKDIIFVVVVATLIWNFGFRLVNVDGVSMEPNYTDGDIVFTDILSYKIGNPKNSDVVVCRSEGLDGEILLKRIIAVPGDTIDIYDVNGRYLVELNGEILKEDYIKEKMTEDEKGKYPYTLEENEYFVMGDNRNQSADSRNRIIGVFPKDDIIGKVRFTIIDRD